MDDPSRLPWIIAVLLLFAAAFFAVTETAFASCSRTRIRIADDHGNSRAKEALYVLDNFDRAISTLLIKAGYTVRIATREVPGKKTKEKVIEFWEDGANG